MDLSIIVVAHNVKDLVDQCFSHVKASRDTLEKEIIFVDNGSTDGTVPMIHQQFPEVKVIESPTNLGFILANNLGYEKASGKYILMLNSDAFIGENTLQVLTDFMEKTPDSGVVGCRAIDNEGNLLPSARYFPTPWRLFLTKIGLAGKFPFWKDINDMKQSHNFVRECDWVTGCCLMTRKTIVDQFSYFLRPDFFMYNDDNDLCLRIKRKGWKVIFHPETIVHLQGYNNKKIAKEKQEITRIEQLNLESQYIYFRHNYNVINVFAHFLLIVLHDLIQLLKSTKSKAYKKHLSHMKIAYNTLRNTRWGKKAIDRDLVS